MSEIKELKRELMVMDRNHYRTMERLKLLLEIWQSEYYQGEHADRCFDTQARLKCAQELADEIAKESKSMDGEISEIKELMRNLFDEQEISAGLLRRALKAEQELKATNSILDEADTLIDALYASGDIKMTNEELIQNYLHRPVEGRSK